MYTNAKSNVLSRFRDLGGTDLPIVEDLVVDLPHFLYKCVNKAGVKTFNHLFSVSSTLPNYFDSW